jgi:hypothetical protein
VAHSAVATTKTNEAFSNYSGCRRILLTIDFASMCNRENLHSQPGIIHLIDDPVIPDSNSIQIRFASKFRATRTARICSRSSITARNRRYSFASRSPARNFSARRLRKTELRIQFGFHLFPWRRHFRSRRDRPANGPSYRKENWFKTCSKP